MTPDFILGHDAEGADPAPLLDDAPEATPSGTRVKVYDGLKVELGENATADTLGSDSNGA